MPTAPAQNPSSRRKLLIERCQTEVEGGRASGGLAPDEGREKEPDSKGTVQFVSRCGPQDDEERGMDVEEKVDRGEYA